MRVPRPVLVTPTMLRRWAPGARRPGVWLSTPAGRLRPLIPFGRPVESVYGPAKGVKR